MKFICVILALIVLTLSAQPVCASFSTVNNVTAGCCDDDDCEQQDAPKKEKGCKSCNPFQQCSCCAFSVVIPQPIHVVLVHSETAGAVSEAPSVGLPDNNGPGYWQPPNIVA